jgi:hypothetical protein
VSNCRRCANIRTATRPSSQQLAGLHEKLRLIRKRAEGNLRESRRQVAEALRSRDRHRAIHEAVMALHLPVENGRCQCGESYPCPTKEAADEARGRVGHPEEPFPTWS